MRPAFDLSSPPELEFLFPTPWSLSLARKFPSCGRFFVYSRRLSFLSFIDRSLFQPPPLLWERPVYSRWFEWTSNSDFFMWVPLPVLSPPQESFAIPFFSFFVFLIFPISQLWSPTPPRSPAAFPLAWVCFAQTRQLRNSFFCGSLRSQS